ncbi:restriction endonuclease subunit S [Staphylococcus saprophyticus]|uniref:restriction endonuclease subunit S n=1 Tax=Staphylococcus saprophyticus TaxID=29385 RepID=UPI001F38E34C|nr:restriction endonuclease subunit S [Staphylococcus saprophyticus]MCE5130824.1 restriction endonuclease subunit S [Staphylococcus saprophyticus]
MEFKLNELAILKNGKSVKPKLHGNVPVFGSNGIIGYTEEFLFNSSMIIVGRVGANCGSVHFNEGKVWLSDNTIGIETKENINTYYLYYLLKNIKLHRFAGGSAQPLLNQKTLKDISLFILPEKKQNIIGYLLKKIDDKIEINKKIITNLEELSQTLFKRWFVDFEFPDEDGNPYKSSGGEMIDSELGEIPKNWRKTTLGNYIDLDKGLSYKGKFLDKKNEIEESIPMLSLSNFQFYSGFKNEKTKYYFGDFKDKHKVKAGDIIIAATDLTQDRKMLGAPALVPNLNENMIYSLDVFKVKESTLPKYVAYFLMQTNKYREFVEGSATGTTVLRVSKDIILKVPIIIDLNIANEFNEIIKKYMHKIEKLNTENEILVDLRDTLLPKLMSGEIEIPDDIEVNTDEFSI